MAQLRVPPGRAGRLWLRDRLAVADRGVSLLERKLRILRGEQRRLRILAESTDRDWRRCADEARTWSLRAGLAGGQRSLRLATGREPAEATVTWTTVMGVRYPVQVDLVPPDPDTAARIVGSAALVHARAAHVAAVRAAVRQATAQAALRVVDRELTATRVRVRALRRHWIPRLQAALHEVEMALEEQERAEGIRRRHAAQATRTDRRQPR